MLASDERVSQRHQPRADLKVHQQEQQLGQPAAEALEAAEAATTAAAEATAGAGTPYQLPSSESRASVACCVCRTSDQADLPGRGLLCRRDHW